ncbi:hypothetical protein ATY81_12600 [Rhizobium sp. R72]|nr:hypothetical protein ATY81_12600 [Rhizobium sp. R72]OWV94703.1 hypothetical protein ATY80_12600 [Rhizobium sp. R711]
MSSGCVSTDSRATAAAEAKGRVQAAVHLPDLPAECRAKMARVFPRLTEKPRNTQLRWEFAADAEDGKNDRCSNFYDSVKSKYGVN